MEHFVQYLKSPKRGRGKARALRSLGKPTPPVALCGTRSEKNPKPKTEKTGTCETDRTDRERAWKYFDSKNRDSGLCIPALACKPAGHQRLTAGPVHCAACREVSTSCEVECKHNLSCRPTCHQHSGRRISWLETCHELRTEVRIHCLACTYSCHGHLPPGFSGRGFYHGPREMQVACVGHGDVLRHAAPGGHQQLRSS